MIPLVVSSDTLLLVQRAVRAWQLTDGLYDPTVLPAMRAIGYDADFSSCCARPTMVVKSRRDPIARVRAHRHRPSRAQHSACRRVSSSIRAASAKGWPPTS